MSNIQTEINQGVLTVKIHRPERKNSLTTQMYADLANALTHADANDDVKVLVLTGSEGAFTAGNDLDDFVQYPPKSMADPVFRFMSCIAAFTKPLIAAVDGLAIGVGTTMLFHCDLVYISESAKFSMPFVSLGLVPEAGSSLMLPLIAGHQRASEKLLLGEVFTATQAHELGFVNAILPSAEVLAFAQAQAEKLAKLPRGSVTATKALIKRRFVSMEMMNSGSKKDSVQDQIHAEADVFIRRVTGPATLEAISAFKEKRKPNFAGKD